jgi:hypothetical protein
MPGLLLEGQIGLYPQTVSDMSLYDDAFRNETKGPQQEHCHVPSFHFPNPLF